VKIEIVCLDAVVDEIVAAIQQNAHTGLRGDGKIYVAEVLGRKRPAKCQR
jgi:nitrogen regulatory protein PII